MQPSYSQLHLQQKELSFQHNPITPMKYLSRYFLSLFIIIGANAQQKYIIKGQVKDQTSQAHLPFVNVFLEGTTIGTQTDENGNYIINNAPLGKYQLVASMVGYLPKIQNIILTDKTLIIDLQLTEDIKQLGEVNVIAKKNDWENQYKEFEKEFLGTDYKRNDVQILNKDVVDFKYDKESKTLSASSNQPIIIENKVLGYRYIYLLQDFTKNNNNVAFKGVGRYELLKPDNKKDSLTWEKNRVDAYLGSGKHFFKALLSNKLIEDGFKVSIKNKQQELQNAEPQSHYVKATDSHFLKDFNSKSAITPSEIEGFFNIKLENTISVYFTNKYQYLEHSEIKPLSTIEVSNIGQVTDPYSLAYSGTMSKRRIALSLPSDYEPVHEQNNKVKFIGENPFLPLFLQNIIDKPLEFVEISKIKSSYIAGEKIQASATLKQVSSQSICLTSVPLYVDLIDLNKGLLIKHFILKLEDGLATLEYTLPINLPTSNYQIRAYTNWMRNFSENSWYKNNFTVFSTNYSKEKPVNMVSKFDTVTFHAEGGHLVENLKSKVIVETKDNFGLAYSTKFKILNSQKQAIIESETDSIGLAKIDFTPLTNEIYTFHADDKAIHLPLAQKSGTIITVDNISNAEKIRILVQNSSFPTDSFTVALIHQGQVAFWNTFKNDKQSFMLSIPKTLKGGTYTIFLVNNTTQKILSERSICLGNSTENPLQVDNKMIVKQSDFINFNQIHQIEKGLTIQGKIIQSKIKVTKKEVSLSMIIAKVAQDTSQSKKQIFNTFTKGTFRFEDLEFYGKNEVTFVCPTARVEIDSTGNIPNIKKENLPINWKLVNSDAELAELAKRKVEAINNYLQEQKKNTIELEAVSVKARKIADPFDKFANSTPAFTIKEGQIQSFQSTTDVIRNIKKLYGGNSPNAIVKVIVDNFENPMDILDDIRVATIEKIDVYKNTDAAIYNCDIAIKITLFSSRSFIHKNDSYIVNGYYK